MKSISLAAVAAFAFSGAAFAQAQPAQDHSAHQAAAQAQPAQPAAAAQAQTQAEGQAQVAAPAKTEAELAAEAQAAADAQLTPEVRQTQAALLRVIAELQSGTVDFGKFHPQLAAAIQPQQAAITPGLAKLGKVESVRHKGVGQHGRHQFEVKFGTDTTKATTQWFIGFDDKGLINGFEFK